MNAATALSECRLSDLSNPAFDPFLSDEHVFGSIADPWREAAKYRRRSPVSRGSYGAAFGAPADPAAAGRPQYTAWTYDAVRVVLDDPVTFSSSVIHRLGVEKAFGRILIVMEPDEHARWRPFLQAVFSPATVKEWTGSVIRPLVHELIDDFASDGRAELVERFTRRFPFELIYRLLDLPRADIDLFQKLAVTQTFAITPFVEEATEAGGHLADYFRCLVAERNTADGHDLISQLIRTRVAGEALDLEVLIAFLRHILNAAADTSYRTTGCLLVALLSDPAAMRDVRANPSLIPLAIEEALRWEGPVASNFRTVTRDCHLAGVPLEAGAVIYVAQGSANRDEKYFVDSDRFDLHRSRTVRHLGFGSGPHTCVGMQLARVQIREAVKALLGRLPGLRLDPQAPPPVIRGFNFRAPPRLQVVF
jgi:cytochrome P450